MRSLANPSRRALAVLCAASTIALTALGAPRAGAASESVDAGSAADTRAPATRQVSNRNQAPGLRGETSPRACAPDSAVMASAESYVAHSLTFPSSAVFTPSPASDAVDPIGEPTSCMWRVQLRVTAKTLFGVATTSDYIVALKRVGDGWWLLDLDEN